MTPTTTQQPSRRVAKAKQRELLLQWAARYIWWKSPEEALRYPKRILAQVMNLGDYDDVQRMVEALGEEVLREVVRSAEPGQLNERSWVYWHYRLGLVTPDQQDQMPPLPIRRLA